MAPNNEAKEKPQTSGDFPELSLVMYLQAETVFYNLTCFFAFFFNGVSHLGNEFSALN